MARKKDKGGKLGLLSRVGAAIKTSFQGKAFRVGSYSAAVVAIVIAIVVVVNLVVGSIPTMYTKLDTTTDELFTISEQTTKLVGNLNQDVTIYWIVQSGAENSLLEQLLERYTSMSSHIKMVKRDPVVYPNFASEYTAQGVTNNSLVVESGERSKYIPDSEIIVNDYSNYYYSGTYTSEFAGESAITSAIDYVTSDSLPVVYRLTGHGESALPAEAESAVLGENIILEDLNLLTRESVPEDADALLIYGMQSDITEAEAERVLNFLQGGGNLLLMTQYTEGHMPNLTALMAEYGVEAADGIVVEGDQNYSLWGYQHYLLPDINSHEITDPLLGGGYYILMPIAQGLTVRDDARSSLTITELLTTSYSSYSKLEGFNMETYERAEGDIDGPFALGVAVQETVESSGETHIVWLGSPQMLSADVNQTVAGANLDLFLNALGWMCQRENTISIHSKSLMQEALIVPSGSASIWSVVLIGIVPGALLLIGAIVMLRRRRK